MKELMPRDDGNLPARRVYRNPVPLTHPLYLPFDPLARGLSPYAAECGAELLLTAPADGADVALNRQHLNAGNSVALVLNRANQHGVERGTATVAAARTTCAEAAGPLAEARDALDRQAALGSEVVVVAGQQYTRAALPVALDSARRAAERAEARGDFTHRQRRDPGIWGWIASGAIVAIETTAVYAPVFNPSNPISLLQMVGFAGLAFFAAHLGTRWFGHAIRDHREALDTRTAAMDDGFAHIHLGRDLAAATPKEN